MLTSVLIISLGLFVLKSAFKQFSIEALACDIKIKTHQVPHRQAQVPSLGPNNLPHPRSEEVGQGRYHPPGSPRHLRRLHQRDSLQYCEWCRAVHLLGCVGVSALFTRDKSLP